MRFRAFIQACIEAQTETDLFQGLVKFAAGYGADLVRYRMIIENLRHLSWEEGYIFHNYPKALANRYVERNYFAIDPNVQAAMKSNDAFHWFEVGERMPLTPEQHDYLEDIRTLGVVDGLAIPIFSSVGTAAYFGIGSTTAALLTDAAQTLELMGGCHQVHRRFMEMRGLAQDDSANLSKREKEVLTQIARGKSNGAIAEDLGLSEHTVDTLVRRSFLKLGVSDRISAALKAVGAGAIRI